MKDESEHYDAMGLIADPEALRAQADRDGFLFFRGLIPQDALRALRAEVLELVAEEGLLDESHPRMEGWANVPKAESMQHHGISCGTPELYRAVQRLERFHALAHYPKLLDVYRILFEEEVLVHPRHIMRLMFPMQGVAPTDPHQDFIYIDGTQSSWTSWIPIGDCPLELGNLTVLRGSHKAGVLPLRRGAAGAGGMETLIDGLAPDWVTFNFKAGDVLTFPSLAVHKSVPTQQPDRVRLSLDYRYQPQSEPVHESSLKVHMGALDWDDVYARWEDDTHAYYWREQELDVVTGSYLQRHPELVRNAD